MNRVFLIPFLSLFLILIPVVGIFLTIIIIAFWLYLNYDTIYKALNEVNIKHDVQESVDKLDKTAINTKKYKRGDISESELEKGI